MTMYVHSVLGNSGKRFAERCECMSICHLERQDIDRSSSVSRLLLPTNIKQPFITLPRLSDSCCCTGLEIPQDNVPEDHKGTHHSDVTQQLLLAKLMVLAADPLNIFQTSS